MVFFLFLGKEVGETVMYFGCRHKNEDYLYQEELEEAEKKAVLTQLNVAFSRDQDQKVDLTHCFGFQNKPINQAAKRFPVSFLTNWFFFLF